MVNRLLSVLVLTTLPFGNIVAETQIDIEVGSKHLESGNKALAWKALYPLAKQGNHHAQLMLGKMLFVSPEIPNHLQKAEKLLKAAVKGGRQEGRLYLAEIALKKKVDYVAESKAVPSITSYNGLLTDAQKEHGLAIQRKMKGLLNEYGNALRSPSTAKSKVYLVIEDGAKSGMRFVSDVGREIKSFGSDVAVDVFVLIDELKDGKYLGEPPKLPANFNVSAADLQTIKELFGVDRFPVALLESKDNSDSFTFTSPAALKKALEELLNE